MGTSTDAILFYGYCWDEEKELLPEEFGDEWEVLVLKKRGTEDPWIGMPEDDGSFPYGHPRRREVVEKWLIDNRQAIDAWYDLKKAVRQEFGCGIYAHCSGECPMPYVCVETSRKVAGRGYPAKIDTPMIAAGGWGGMLDRFLLELGISKPEGQPLPMWWLVSYWH